MLSREIRATVRLVLRRGELVQHARSPKAPPQPSQGPPRKGRCRCSSIKTVCTLDECILYDLRPAPLQQLVDGQLVLAGNGHDVVRRVPRDVQALPLEVELVRVHRWNRLDGTEGRVSSPQWNNIDRRTIVTLRFRTAFSWNPRVVNWCTRDPVRTSTD